MLAGMGEIKKGRRGEGERVEEARRVWEQREDLVRGREVERGGCDNRRGRRENVLCEGGR